MNSFNEAAGQIFELFDTINSRGEYRALTARFWSEVSKGKALSGKTSRKLAFEIFWKIYDGMDISNQKDRDRAEEQFRNLLRFNNVRNFRQPIQGAIHDLASDYNSKSNFMSRSSNPCNDQKKRYLVINVDLVYFYAC